MAPNTKWVTDIMYIRMAGHWLYLRIVLDLYSGKVVSWTMSCARTTSWSSEPR